MENLAGKKSIKKAITPTDAKKMIGELHLFLKNAPLNIKGIFDKSYSLDYHYFKALIENVPIDGTTKIRIYPSLKEGSLSFVMMIENKGIVLWDSSKPDVEQNAVQDQMLPCPKECPPGSDFLSDEEWRQILG